MDKSYALYLSYNRWLHQEPLDVTEYIDVAEAAEEDPSGLEDQWNDGCFPDGDNIITPDADDSEDES